MENATNPFLTTPSLKRFIEGTEISEANKNRLISRLPELDEGERKSLFDCLKDIYLLDLEEARALERISQAIH